MDDYQSALAWLYARQASGIKLGLDKVHRLLAALGDPQDDFRSVHVAGTNGKGSVVAMLSGVLRRSGHRVGTTTSPHLTRFTERITVDDEPITEAEVLEGLQAIRPIVERLDAEDQNPTFFEIVTALAFRHFAATGVEWAVVETGLGGRLDATNILEPELTVITNVGLDHARFLGEDVAEVAYEKAGIMKPGVPCVTGTSGAGLLVLKAVSQERQVAMSILGEDYLVHPDLNGFRLVRPSGESHYRVGVAGEHQLENAALVVAAVDALRVAGVHVPERALQDALEETRIPGRLERFITSSTTLAPDAAADERHNVELLLDCAHNAEGAHALRRHLGHIDWQGFHLVVGINRDKPWREMVAQWVPLAAHVWAVPVPTGRTLDPQHIAQEVEGSGIPCHVLADTVAALRTATIAGADKIVVAGSLFLVGVARAILTGEPTDEIRGDQ